LATASETIRLPAFNLPVLQRGQTQVYIEDKSLETFHPEPGTDQLSGYFEGV
jgi:hypothetical protein